MNYSITTAEADSLCARLARYPHLAVLVDLDGTLVPFTPIAEAAAMLDRAAIDVLDGLHHTGVEVVVVSGRPRPLVEPFAKAMRHVRWVAEHGSWCCNRDGAWTGPRATDDLDGLLRVLRTFAATPGVHIESKSRSIALHWRNVAADAKKRLIADVELACDEWLEEHPEFERLEAVEVVEVRDRTVNKGLAVAWTRQVVPDARIIAIGDDETDEDMFAALREDELAIGVGGRRSRSRCWLSGPLAVHAFLWWLVQARTTGVTRPFLALECRRPSRVSGSKLIVVSNRVSLSFLRKPVAGLVSTLEPALKDSDAVWLGWSGEESTGHHVLVVDDETRPLRASFDFEPSWRQRFYAGFCNHSLWPLLHGFPGRVRYSDQDWHGYVEANVEYARRVHELVAPDGLVWVHDYQLLLVARELRKRGFRGATGLFLHVPFPQTDLLDTLPWLDELLEAMLDFDLVGFHTAQWAENFAACVRMRKPSRTCPDLGVFPMGVDPAKFVVDDHAPDREVTGLREVLGQRKMILGVDRLDFAKGIPERLLAFEELLETKPHWCNNVSFVQISVPSRSEVPDYQDLRYRVEGLVGRINGRFGEADWIPVRYLYRSYDHDVLAQLYRLADVALVTPLRDGLNLVAKEFVVAQDPARPGVLVLSQFAGASAELTEAVITNPYHVDGVAADLD